MSAKVVSVKQPDESCEDKLSKLKGQLEGLDLHPVALKRFALEIGVEQHELDEAGDQLGQASDLPADGFADAFARHEALKKCRMRQSGLG